MPFTSGQCPCWWRTADTNEHSMQLLLVGFQIQLPVAGQPCATMCNTPSSQCTMRKLTG